MDIIGIPIMGCIVQSLSIFSIRIGASHGMAARLWLPPSLRLEWVPAQNSGARFQQFPEVSNLPNFQKCVDMGVKTDYHMTGGRTIHSPAILRCR